MRQRLRQRQRQSISSPHCTSAKHVPLRTCVACRQERAKRELIRLVRGADGHVEIDTTGRKAGRGAYLCPAGECLETGLKSNRLEHALRGSLSEDNRRQLVEELKDLIKGAATSGK